MILSEVQKGNSLHAMSTEGDAPMGVGRVVRQRRLALGMSQKELADLAGVGPTGLSKLEVGDVALPNADIRRRLARALGIAHVELLIAAGEVTPQEVWGYDEPPPPDPVRDGLHTLVDRADLSGERAELLRLILREWVARPAPPSARPRKPDPNP